MITWEISSSFVLQSVSPNHGTISMFSKNLKLIKTCDSYTGPNSFSLFFFPGHEDLAIQIIQLHPYLIERRDEKGYLALHYLAEKPFAFRSGTSLGIVETIIYNCKSLSLSLSYYMLFIC